MLLYFAYMPDLVVLDGSTAQAWGLLPGWGAVAFIPSTAETMKIVDQGFDPAKKDDVLPLAAAIQWYHYRRKPKGLSPVVDVVTDSLELMVSSRDPLRGPDGSDWRFMRWFQYRGYVITWHRAGKCDDDAPGGISYELREYAKRCQDVLAGRFRGAGVRAAPAGPVAVPASRP